MPYSDEDYSSEYSEEKKADNKKTRKAITRNDNNDNSSDQAGKPDGNGGLNQPTVRIEYASNSRAACKRCYERIQQGDLRISSRPLFRGKPGYIIYKHLECTVFTEDVLCAEDIDGYEDLDIDDYERLAQRVSASAAEVQLEMQELEPEELVQKDFRGTLRAVPPGLNATLLPFQREGCSWMYCQEVGQSDPDKSHDQVVSSNMNEVKKCGILADEMGMGKTVQTIALILDHRPILQHCVPNQKHPPDQSEQRKNLVEHEEKLWEQAYVDWKHEMDMCNVSPSVIQALNKNKKGVFREGGGKSKRSVTLEDDQNNIDRAGSRAGTLVICPVAALTQWKTEIEKFCEPGSVSVVIYHGPNRERLIPRQMLRKFDVVLTTYQVLEADFRKMTSPNRVKCPNCGGKFKIDKLRIHLKYFCGEAAERTEAQARQRRNRDRPILSSVRPESDSDEQRHVHGKANSKTKKSKRSNLDESTDSKKSKEEEKKGFVDITTQGAKADDNNKKIMQLKGHKRVFFISSTKLSQDKKRVKLSTMGDDDNVLVSSTSQTNRSQRKAATVACERLKASTTEAYGYVESSEDDSDYGAPPSELDLTSVEADSLSGSEDEIFIRVRETQKMALQKAKILNKKSDSSVKKISTDARQKKTVGRPQIKKDPKAIKKFENESSDSDSSEDFIQDDGLDMDDLLEEAMAGAKMSALHSVCWWRIVLDEAHMIKSRSSQTAAAAFSLIGVHRWCLSGTPLQNRVGEFYSLVRFLRLDPMAHYLCRHKECTCKSIHYRMFAGKCKGCGHGSVEHYSHFNKHILNPIQRDGYSGDGRKAMFTLKTQILDPYVIRRTKITKAEDMQLPPRLVEIRSVRLHPVEEDFYNALYTQTKSNFDTYVQEGVLLNNYAHIFDLLIRMRQSVAHPYLVLFSKNDTKHNQSEKTRVNVIQDCCLCHEPPIDRLMSTCCEVAFCRTCVDEFMETEMSTNSIECPSCRRPFSIDLNQKCEDVHDDGTLSVSKTSSRGSAIGMPSIRELVHVSTGSILRRIDLANFSTSTKIEALAKELVNMRQSSPASKAIVFSQFVNMLDLIRWRLHSDPFLEDLGLGVVALHGGMDVKSRDSTLKQFRENPQCRVLLMSLKAGGVALNLTVADHIYLMDPWWNPAAENQAIDRTHRLGQYRPIKAIRFIAENTVEERILQLQEKKRLVFDGTVGRDAASLKMLSIEDMKCLFT